MKHHYKTYLLSFMGIFLGCIGVYSQIETFSEDSTAFYHYLYPNNLYQNIQVVTLHKIYQRLNTHFTKDEMWRVGGKREAPGAPGIVTYTLMDRPSGGDVGQNYDLIVYGRWPGESRLDSFMFPDSLYGEIKQAIAQARECGIGLRAERDSLIKNLTDFSKVATHFPVFFIDIDNHFHGNIDKYVRNLYRKSIFCNQMRLTLFARKPTTQKLLNDPGVQFVISLLRYEQWIKEYHTTTCQAQRIIP